MERGVVDERKVGWARRNKRATSQARAAERDRFASASDSSSSSDSSSRRAGPSRAEAARSAADAVVGEAQAFERLAAVDVAAVEDHGGLELALHGLEIGPAELVPLGDQDQAVGAHERVHGLLDVLD